MKRQLPQIPAYIQGRPSDFGHDDSCPKEWAWIIQHELDLYTEGQDSPDITNENQAAECRLLLKKLTARYTAPAGGGE